MTELSNEDLVRRYLDAGGRNDLDALEAMRTSEWQMRWPSSGELVPSSAAYRSIHQQFPGGFPRFDTLRIVGTEDRYIVSPANTVLRIAGNGDVWIGEARLRYGDGTEWYQVKLLELRDGKVHRETDYWAPITDPPAWRAALSEPLPKTSER
jgi:ketosteroid isomerase-like protein